MTKYTKEDIKREYIAIFQENKIDILKILECTIDDADDWSEAFMEAENFKKALSMTDVTSMMQITSFERFRKDATQEVGAFLSFLIVLRLTGDKKVKDFLNL